MGTLGIAEEKLSACARDWQGLCSAAPNGYPAALRATPAKILCSEIALPGYVGSWVQIRTSPALLSSFHKLLAPLRIPFASDLEPDCAFDLMQPQDHLVLPGERQSQEPNGRAAGDELFFIFPFSGSATFQFDQVGHSLGAGDAIAVHTTPAARSNLQAAPGSGPTFKQANLFSRCSELRRGLSHGRWRNLWNRSAAGAHHDHAKQLPVQPSRTLPMVRAGTGARSGERRVGKE